MRKVDILMSQRNHRLNLPVIKDGLAAALGCFGSILCFTLKLPWALAHWQLDSQGVDKEKASGSRDAAYEASL